MSATPEFASIDALRKGLGGTKPAHDPVYAAKQLHAVPEAPVVNRREFILERVKGKRVLEFGASGPMHDAIVKAAKSCFGVDREDAEGVEGFDLDEIDSEWSCLPGYTVNRETGARVFPQYDVIVCGEVLEHLSNPGWFLERVKSDYPGTPVLITVPNAHSLSGIASLQKGIENCNRDHVAWYSYRTLLTLVSRVGYTVKEFAWYNGKPLFAEGLIMVVE